MFRSYVVDLAEIFTNVFHKLLLNIAATFCLKGNRGWKLEHNTCPGRWPMFYSHQSLATFLHEKRFLRKLYGYIVVGILKLSRKIITLRSISCVADL